MKSHADDQSSLARMLSEVREQRAVLVAYLLCKAKAEDWHAVADAAMDIREIDAKLSVLT